MASMIQSLRRLTGRIVLTLCPRRTPRARHSEEKLAKPGRARDVAQSFRLQAEDYFLAATSGRELAVKPVLLYYA